jgi:heme A synthase
VPNLGYTYLQVMLEWVHRLIAGVFVGPLVLALGVMTLRRRNENPGLALAGGLLVFLLLIQGALGGLTVLDGNSPWSVAIHLGTALLVLTVTLRILVGASTWPVTGAPAALLVPTVLSWFLALLAMLSAAVTAKSGASLACATWPLCNGEFVPDLGDEFVRINFTHRVLAALTGGALLFLLWRSRALDDLPDGLRRLVALAACLVVLEIGLGALVILLQVPTWKAVLHQAVGVLTFAVVTLILWRCVPAASGAGDPKLGGTDGLALRRA